jgi:hypothetical protein
VITRGYVSEIVLKELDSLLSTENIRRIRVSDQTIYRVEETKRPSSAAELGLLCCPEEDLNLHDLTITRP